MRQTKSRTQILDFFKNNTGAFSAGQIHQSIPEIDLATIYRNLNLFCKQGKLRELNLVRGESLYELAGDKHDHAICTGCGKILHIQIDKSKLVNLIELDDFEVEDVEVIIHGHCPHEAN